MLIRSASAYFHWRGLLVAYHPENARRKSPYHPHKDGAALFVNDNLESNKGNKRNPDLLSVEWIRIRFT